MDSPRAATQHAVVRLPAAACLILSTIGLVLPMPTVAAGPVVFAEGPTHQVLTEENDGIWHDCEGDGRASIAWTQTPRRLMVTVAVDGCTPTWSLITNCGAVLEDGTFRCERRNAGETLNVTLTPSGAFEFLWSTATFMEWDVGTLTRVQ